RGEVSPQSNSPWRSRSDIGEFVYWDHAKQDRGAKWVSRSAGGGLLQIKTAARSPRPTKVSPRPSERSARLHLIGALHPITALDLISVLIPRGAPDHRSTRQLVRPT